MALEVATHILKQLRPRQTGFPERVRRHGLGPLAYVSGDREFRHDYLASLAMAERREVCLKDVAMALSQADVSAAAIKGASYVGWLYEDSALRPMTDIDLLVRPSRHGAASTVLESLGFARFDWAGSRSRFHHATTFHRGREYIDLHRNIQQPLRTDFDTDALLDRASDKGRHGLRQLRTTDAALVHFAHIARSEFSVPALSFVDGALLLARLTAAERSTLEVRARHYRVERGVRAGIAMTEALSAAQPWVPTQLWSKCLPLPGEIIARKSPPRAIQLVRKFALCDDMRSVAGLVAGTLLDRLR